MSDSMNPGRAVTAILTVLQANLPAQFDTIDAEIADGLALEDPHAYLRAPLPRYHGYPVLVLFPVESGPVGSEGDEEGQFAGFEQRRHVLELHYLVVSNEGTNSLLPQEAMEQRLERSLMAITEVLDANRSLSGTGMVNAKISVIGAWDFSDFEINPQEQLGRSAALSVEVLCE